MSVEKYQSVSQHLDGRLIWRLRVFCVIFPVKLELIVLEVVDDQIEVGLVFGGIVIGVILGMVMSHIYHLSWDDQTSRVVAQINWIGGIFLALYIVLLIGRYWIGTPTVVTFGLCISAGFMLGRLVGVRRGVLKIVQVLQIS